MSLATYRRIAAVPRLVRGLSALVVTAGIASPAAAADDRIELWLNPSISAELDERHGIELETGQRFRADPADDTYFARLWISRSLGRGTTLSAGIERRHEGRSRETRLLQQIGYPLIGPLKGRTRVEQRFVEGTGRTGVRVTQRIGVAAPLRKSAPDDWSAVAYVEGFLTLRPTTGGGDRGVTGVRTFLGVEREFRRVDVTIGYLRQQSIRRNGPDTVGHAPLIGLTYKI